jgi:putative endonuclease
VEEKQYCVYIMTNKGNSVLDTGVTNDLRRRVYQHKTKMIKGFTERYNISKLVYYEVSQDVESAILRKNKLRVVPGPRRLD